MINILPCFIDPYVSSDRNTEKDCVHEAVYAVKHPDYWKSSYDMSSDDVVHDTLYFI